MISLMLCKGVLRTFLDKDPDPTVQIVRIRIRNLFHTGIRQIFSSCKRKELKVILPKYELNEF